MRDCQIPLRQGGGDRLRCLRSSEVISLQAAAAGYPQQVRFVFALHSFGGDFQRKALGKDGNRLNDALGRGIGRKAPDKRLVDLQSVERILPEVADARVPGSEIVQCDLYPGSMEGLDQRLGTLLVLDEVSLRNLELEPLRRKAGLLENG